MERHTQKLLAVLILPTHNWQAMQVWHHMRKMDESAPAETSILLVGEASPKPL